ncbi:MAG: type VI secretion protein IcmF/TssM N-terminal domain-containing protein, partial [Anaerolineales bacterium]
MKQTLVLILKGLLALTIVALALLLVFGLVLLIGWPWWVGFFVLVGLAGLTLGIVVLRKFLKRRQEQMFVHQIIEQDESAAKRMAPQEQNASKELQARWKEAIDALRKSHLRKYGNPLYVLPWYMVIGESGSGKTTAIKSARLSSPFAEVTRTSGISGTRNCDWWFFEQAILIDTAGRYAIPVDEGRDKDEWQSFLGLLARFRKKEPLNGLVVTVAADRLAQNSPETLMEDGRKIRRRIDELMRVLGARFPVYVMVTKCDLIQGATQFCDRLPESALDQAMGVLNHKMSPDVGGLTDRAFRTVGDRLRDLRLLLLNKVKEAGSATAMLLFPEEFEKLKEPLAGFIAGAFQENPYQESPLLRGLFFSSGRQEGTPFSHFLNALGLIQGRRVLSGTSKGLFLHDLFARILPSDRRLFTPTQYMAQWRRLTRNMGLTAWIALMVAACGLLSYAFVKNLNALSDLRREFSNPAILQGDLVSDVITMDRFRQALLKAQDQNRNWWVPRLGLNASLTAERELKQKYVKLFHTGFLSDFDKRMGERLAHFSAGTPGTEFGANVAYLVRRINVLKACLNNEDLEQLEALPQPAYTNAVLMRNDVIPEVEAKLGQQYLYAITWQRNKEGLNKEVAYLQTWLKHLLSLPGVTLDWLVDWVDSDPDMKAVALSDFWGSDPKENAASVAAAYTREGEKRIQDAIANNQQIRWLPE